MNILRLLSILVVSMCLAACHTAPNADSSTPIATGEDLLHAMHARYAGRWYERLRVTQQEVYYDQDGTPKPEQTWVETIHLPGRVHSAIDGEDTQNAELYVDGAFHVIRDGRIEQTHERPHPVLHLGYDVYCQPPDTTAIQLRRAGFGFQPLREATWNDQTVYIVGVPDGDLASPQFWVDTDQLLCRRIITRTLSGRLLDIHFTAYTEFAGVWLCTELKFYVDGSIVLHEWDVEHELLDTIDPAIFSLP